MKEFPNEPKNKWTQIFKKKWFFPAVYIVLAAFLISGVVWYQNMESKLMEGLDDIGQMDESESTPFDKEEAESVLQQDEIIKMPVPESIQTEIVTKFYDYEAEDADQEKAVTFYNNRYYQSTGVDIASDDGEAFDVVASLSGEVLEVKEDPLQGNVVVLDHGNEISTYYASLENVAVETGDKLEQGGQLGTAGRNLFSEESGTHVHFEMRKDDVQVNPEEFFNETVKTLVDFDVDAEAEDSKEEAETPADENLEDETDTPSNENGEDESNPEDEADDPQDAGDDVPGEDESDQPEKEEMEESQAGKSLSLSVPA